MIFRIFFFSSILAVQAVGRPFRPSRRQKRSLVSHRAAPCRDPAFHKTIIITVPFGPSVFEKVIFSLKIGSTSVFVCVSLCCVLYDILITFVDKTPLNAQPLSPPIFEKIAPHFKNNVFSYFGSLRLYFLNFHIFVDFRLPLSPPLGQIGPICDRLRFHFFNFARNCRTTKEETTNRYPRSIDLQSKHKLLLQFAEPSAQRRGRQCAPTLFFNSPTALARRNARKRSATPFRGARRARLKIRFLLVFASS